MDNVEKERLMKQYDPLINKLSYRYFLRILSPEDMQQELRMRMWKLLDTYDPTKGVKLISYLTKFLKFRRGTILRKEMLRDSSIYLDNSIVDFVIAKENKDYENKLDFIHRELAKLPRGNITLEIMNGRTQTAIAKELGVTHQRVAQINEANIKQLKKVLANEQYRE